ncbi:DUF4421 family protein [Lewinella sp. 4G2]|uniref:DUF4421 family protein n=1 Tax=Lewinella sp. 4G2 TaxID=1803372 RepID=UPI0007B4EAEC|nr:DUF4421 family protein [Lewinella sp. 4G2]OAV45224.1 hypothetical protein A3850_012290 [Lewinella sp. 4G2]
MISVAQMGAQRWDSIYVEDLPFRYRINGGLRVINDFAEFTTAQGETFQLDNRNLALRLGGRYGFASYTFSYAISDLGTAPEDEPTKNFGLGLRLFRRYGFVQTRFQITEGFRLTGPENESVFRPDVKLFTAFLHGYHIMGKRRVSMRSSFNQRERQLKSRGGWLLGGTAIYNQLRADGLNLRPANDDVELLTGYNQIRLSVGGGYVYNYIFKERYFITPVVFLGPELRSTRIDRFGSSVPSTDRLSVGLQTRSSLSVGWHGSKKFAALIGHYVPGKDQTEQLSTQSLRSRMELRLGVQW